MSIRCCLLFSVLLHVSSVARANENSVAVLDMQGSNIDSGLLPTLTEVLSAEVAALRRFQVIAGRDIDAMLGFENQKEMLGCNDAACLAEIGGALGVDRVVDSHVGKVGNTFVVNIKLINIRNSSTESRVYETVQGEVDALLTMIRSSVSKLFAHIAMPAAKPGGETESNLAVHGTAAKKDGRAPGVLPALLWGGGLAAVGGGIGLGLMARSAEAKANDPEHVGGQRAAAQAPRLALGANILFGVGAAAVLAGGLVYFLGGSSDASHSAWAPIVTPDSVGLAYSNRF